jgi:hypothetical protein
VETKSGHGSLLQQLVKGVRKSGVDDLSAQKDPHLDFIVEELTPEQMSCLMRGTGVYLEREEDGLVQRGPGIGLGNVFQKDNRWR